jgi:hypothetical protein
MRQRYGAGAQLSAVRLLDFEVELRRFRWRLRVFDCGNILVGEIVQAEDLPV